ncbi:MAG: nuclear transport factor 2 family protein [Desulfovibrio sp.]|uniref:YybH family protein n=1 Tax=Desulfovibrio sp. TaxID=885 RepID=UPI002588697B|nr:nuclear transport factor 2 family protein [Desulfovibrio sp.]MCD7984591.1 nuclear transport factor 2 family protein [Desulfovibrio sp.]
MSHQENAGQELREKIEMYRNSIIHADKPELAAQVWAVAPETSFIHPRGHERGWDEIRENFYRNTMAKRFSTRDLRLTGEPVIHVYGDAAVAEFDWEFTATLREGGAERRTSGRESQVYVRRPGQGWRLVHVHYSGPAATA